MKTPLLLFALSITACAAHAGDEPHPAAYHVGVMTDPNLEKAGALYVDNITAKLKK